MVLELRLNPQASVAPLLNFVNIEPLADGLNSQAPKLMLGSLAAVPSAEPVQ